MIFLSFVKKYLFMYGFGCFFRVNNLEFDSLWLSLALSFVGAGLMLFLIFCYKTYFWMDVDNSLD